MTNENEAIELYYIQRVHSEYLGNAPVWWAVGNNGYTSYIQNAKRFTFEEAEKLVTDANWELKITYQDGKEVKAELNEQLEIKKQMRVAVVQIVDAIAEYFGTRNPAVVKLLEQVKELR